MVLCNIVKVGKLKCQNLLGVFVTLKGGEKMIDTSAFQISQKIQPKKEPPVSKPQNNGDNQSFAAALSDKMNARDTVDNTKKQPLDADDTATQEGIAAQESLMQYILAMLGVNNPVEPQTIAENVLINDVSTVFQVESIAEIPVVVDTPDSGILQPNVNIQTEQAGENATKLGQTSEQTQTVVDSTVKGEQMLPQTQNNTSKDILLQIDKSNSNQLDVHSSIIDNTKPTQSVEVKEVVSNPIVAETKIQAELSDKPIIKQENQNNDVSVKNFADNGLNSEAKVVKSQTSAQDSNMSDESAEQNSSNAKNENTLSTEKDNKTSLLVGHDLKRTSVDTTFVKISDAATKLDAEVPVQTQVVDAIKTQISNGKTEFIMHLNPQSLGKVAVKLVMEAGMLTVELIADNPRTQSLLAANASEIKELVQASTNNNTQVVSSNQSENLQQNYTQQESNKDNKNNQQNLNEQDNCSSEQENTSTPIEFYSVLQHLSQQARMRTMV